MDVAKLAFEFDATSAVTAEKQIDSLTAASGRLDQAAARSRAAFGGGAFDQATRSTGAYEQSMRSLVGVYGQARDALGRFTAIDGSFRMSQEATATMMLRNASAAAALAKEADALDKRVARLTASYDPLQAAMDRTNKELVEAKDLFDRGALSAEKYGQATAALNARLGALQKAHKDAAGSARLQTHELTNLGRQGADVFVQLASGQGVMMTLIQQGPQIADVFSTAAARGVGFKAALTGIAAQVGPMLAVVGPIIAIGGAIAVVTKAAIDGEKAVNDFSNAVAITGNSANLTAEQYEQMVSRVALSTQSGFGTARETILGLVSSGKVSGDAIETLALDIVNLSEYTGKSTDEISRRFLGMKGSVADFARELHDDYNGLIAPAIIKNIADLEEQGKRADATRLLYGTLLSDLAEKGPAKVGTVEKAFRGLNDVLGLTLQLLSGISNKQAGAAAVGQINVAQLRNQIAGDKATLNGPLGFLANRSSIQAQIDDNQRRLDALLGTNKPKPTAGSGSGMSATATAAAEEAELRLRRQIAEADKTNADARLKLAESVARADAVAKGISGAALNNIAKLARQAEQKSIDRDAASAARTAASAASKVIRADNRGDNELERARSAELAAQLSTTKNIEQIAGLKAAQIAQELTSQKVRLAGLVEEKRINEADAKTALASYEKVAAYKQQAADQQMAAELLQAELASRQAYTAYLDQMDKYASEAATTQQERNAIELAGLKRRQGEEAYALAASNALKVASGEISAMAAADVELRQKNLAFAQTESELRAQANEIIDRDVSLRQAGLQTDIDLLQSRQGFAQSEYEAARIQRQIIEKRFDGERLAVEALEKKTGVDADALRAAKDRLAVLGLIKDNELKQLDQSANMVTAMTAAIDAVDQMARAFSSGDIGAGISGLSKSLKEASGILSGIQGLGGLGGTLGSIGKFLGPIGGLVSSVTSLFGGLFGGSSKKKREREAAEEAARQAELERQQKITDTHREIEIALLRATGQEAAALAAERADELAALSKLDPALAAYKQQLFDATDAATKAAEEAEKQAEAQRKVAEVAERAASIQDQIDRLTLSSADLLTKSRAKERAEAVALDPALGALVDQLYGLQDAAAKAAIEAQAAADALALQHAQQGALADYLDAIGSSDKATAIRRALELEAITDPLQRQLKEMTWQAQDAAKASEEATERYKIEAQAISAAATAWKELVTKVNEARESLLRMGDVAGAMAGELSISKSYQNLDPGDALGGAAIRSDVAKGLLDRVMEDALNVQYVNKVVGKLVPIIQSDILQEGLNYRLADKLMEGLDGIAESSGSAIKAALGVVGTGAGMGAPDSVFKVLAARNMDAAHPITQSFASLANVLVAKNQFTAAGQEATVGGKRYMGEDVIAYQKAILSLDGSLDRGVITLEQYATATTNLRAAMGDTLAIVDDLSAQVDRWRNSAQTLAAVGQGAITYYFGQIGKAAEALAAASTEAAEPISLVAQAIGRLTSYTDVFGESVKAVMTGGRYSGAVITDDVSKASLIAESAAIAAQAMTTAEAARVAEQIAKKAAFEGVDATGIRDASLLLGDLKAFDPVSFENTFTRLNDALIKGKLTEDQYGVLFEQAMETYQGLDDKISEVTKTFDDLRKTAKGLADQLSITEAASPALGLAEAERQYRATLAAAMGGDSNAISGLNGAVSALVDAGKGAFSSSDQQADLVARIVSDMRQAEIAQPVNPYVEANAPVVSELQGLRQQIKDLQATMAALQKSAAATERNTKTTADKADADMYG